MSKLGLLTDSFSIKLPERKLNPSKNFLPAYDSESQESVQYRLRKFNEIQQKLDQAINDIIETHHQNSIKDISQFLYNSNALRNHLPLLETAIILTGYNRSDHDSFYSQLMKNPDFLFAKLSHINSLKDVVKSINQQISSNEELEASELEFQRVLEIQRKTGKQIVVIIPHFEEFNLQILEKLIHLLIQSSQIKLLIGTFTLDQINSLSPRALNSLITKPFQLENSKEILDEITRVIMNMDFKLGYTPFKAIFDNFNLSFLSIEMFRNSVKYCLMSYCFGNPLVGLLELPYESFDKTLFDLVRMLHSFKTFVNGEIKSISEEESKMKIKHLLTDDKVLFDWIKEKTRELRHYIRDFNNAILVFEKMQSLFSTNSLKRPTRILYLDALKSNLGDTDYCKSCLLLLRKLQLPVLKQFLLDCSLIVHDKSGFLDIIDEIPEVDLIEVEQEDEKYIIKEGLKRVRQELSSTRKRNQLDLSFSLFEEKPDEQILSKIITFLSNYFTENLKAYSGIVLNELLFFDSNVNKAVKAEPRAVIQTALKYPQMYINTIVDTNILYKLYLECGRLINLQDWFEAFKILCKHDNIEARFLKGVNELQFLGFIKSTNRKTDHVQRLTWG
ncbi:Origin recognition complex subunit 3 [Boothiomyces sp. JEL0866]|nr:Origin recognition complex subunit 3 [Boothiomyces sp. JEL0866]